MLIPLEKIDQPRVLLREVDTQSPEYRELRASIGDVGILESILVRPVGDRFEIIEGNHRFTVARELGHKTIPCLVRSCSDEEALEWALKAQHKIPLSRIDIARQLLRIQNAHPEMTLAKLARLAGKSMAWVSNHLNLLNLKSEILWQVNTGIIPTTNAYELARLPERIQNDFVERAILMSRQEFRQVVKDAIVELSVNWGSNRSVPNPDPKPVCRNFQEILKEYRTKPEDRRLLGWNDAIEWVLCMDLDTLERRKKEYEERAKSNLGEKFGLS